jgi:hypothetical protein
MSTGREEYIYWNTNCRMTCVEYGYWEVGIYWNTNYRMTCVEYEYWEGGIYCTGTLTVG